MNTFNRVVLVLLLLLVMVLCSFVLIVPIQSLEIIGRQAEALADLLSRVRPIARLPIGILLALIIDLLGILLIVLEVRRRESRSIKVEQASGGEVTLSVASIADQLKAELSHLPEIVQAKPKVSAKRKGVVVEVDARIEAEAGVPNKAERIVEVIRRTVEQKMGLKLARPPKVNVETVRPPSESRRSRRQSVVTPVTESETGGTTEEES